MNRFSLAILPIALYLLAATVVSSSPAQAAKQLIQRLATDDERTAMTVCAKLDSRGGHVTIVSAQNHGITAFCEETNPNVIVARVDVYPHPMHAQLHRVMVDRFRESAARFHPDLHGNEGPFDTDIIWPQAQYPGLPLEPCQRLHGQFQSYDLCYYDGSPNRVKTPQALLDLE